MGKQSDIIQASEADSWFQRNLNKDRSDDPMLKEILGNPNLKPLSVLEIGCGTGWRLARLKGHIPGVDCRGCDLSWEAINYGRSKFTKLGLRNSPAHETGYPSNTFDLVILGFFLYLADREHLFQIVAEADRLLIDKGALIVQDFVPDKPHSRDYAHDRRLTTYKMGYHQLWLANPSYSLEQLTMYGEGDDREGVFTLRKDHGAGWPRRET